MRESEREGREGKDRKEIIRVRERERERESVKGVKYKDCLSDALNIAMLIQNH